MTATGGTGRSVAITNAATQRRRSDLRFYSKDGTRYHFARGRGEQRVR